MSKRIPALLLEDIIEAIDKIKSYTKDMSFSKFAEDDKTIDAVVRNFEIIGEAANQLPKDFLSKYPAIEWHKIIAIRHRVIHEYFGVDFGIIWAIIQNNLNELRSQVTVILDTEQ